MKALVQESRFFLLSLLNLVLLFILAYHLERNDLPLLFGLYSVLFILFWLILKSDGIEDHRLAYSGLLFRLVFLIALPNLSQDFYRFIWDGRMIANGLNPYLYTPESLVGSEFAISQAKTLVEGMGGLSAGNYTNYPPLNQLIFAITALFAGKSILGSVMIMRIVIICADIGVYYFGRKLLQHLNLNPKYIFLYFLNPFVITELTGNLHFEGVMVFFLIWSLYLLVKGKWHWSALILACSVSVKLIPLIFLPFLFRYLGMLKSLGYYLIIGLFNLLLFLPFYSGRFITNYTETVGLWFQKFEFNASLYYIAREIGYSFRGWNEIEIIGSYIPKVVLLAVLCLALLRNNRGPIRLISGMLLALGVYLFCSTTVHPWYIITLLALSVFTKYRFPLVWSFFIVLSYSAYSNNTYQENLWLVSLEYLAVYACLFYELFRSNPKLGPV